MSVLRSVVLTSGCAVVAAACAPRGSSSSQGARDSVADAPITVVHGSHFADVFRVVDTLVLEESDTVVTVAPQVSMDPEGDVLVTDSRENQVRVYSLGGTLRRVVGAGTGIAESLATPYSAVRLADGALMAATLSPGRLTMIPKQGAHRSHVFATPLVVLHDVKVLDPGELLLSGSDTLPPKAFLHIWDIGTHRIVRSFFPPPSRFDRGVTTTFSAVRTAIRHGEIAAAYMVWDTLAFFDARGNALRSVRIPIAPFTAAPSTLPAVSSLAERQERVNELTMIMKLFWIADDRLVVQWAKGSSTGTQWGIVEMDTTGHRVWAVAPSPRLYAVHQDTFFFQSPDTPAPNRWLVAVPTADSSARPRESDLTTAAE